MLPAKVLAGVMVTLMAAIPTALTYLVKHKKVAEPKRQSGAKQPKSMKT
jgi:hypothetical protein